jgi:hypothetical protein
MEHANRTATFKRNQALEDLLHELNTSLAVAEATLQLPQEPAMPVILVVGAPRSGTTVLMQWLAASGHFAVPSNLLSRFYAAPYLGGRIQCLLVDPRFDHQGELADAAAHDVPYRSHVGKTKGMIQPNEFWYFWRRFIPNTDPEWISPEDEARIDVQGFRAGVAAIEAAFRRPFATKGIILQYNLRCLLRIFPKLLVIHTRRHPFYNIQSLLKARRDYFGDEGTWFSVKPKEYPHLRHLSPVEQVTGQVFHTRSGIDAELAQMPQEHGLIIDHEAFCADPAGFHDTLVAKLAALGHRIEPPYTGPAHFDVHERVLVDDVRREEILAAYRRASGERLPLL